MFNSLVSKHANSECFNAKHSNVKHSNFQHSSSKYPKRLRATLASRVERTLEKRIKSDNVIHRCRGLLVGSRSARHYHRWVKKILDAGSSFSDLSTHEFQAAVDALKVDLLRHGMTDKLLVKTFACVREASGRSLGMYHFESQIIGGLAMFHGNISEMQTGEGKTLTATLPAAAAALMGVPVHVVTVNDYLAKRDAEIMTPVYDLLGLSVGCIEAEQSVKEKQAIYGKNIVYCTNKDLVFDYLKDQLVLKNSGSNLRLSASVLKGQMNTEDQLMQRGLHFALIDEADSVLMDEARTPLIISGESEVNPGQEAVYYEAIDIAKKLVEKQDYIVNRKTGGIRLSKAGEERIPSLCDINNAFWRGRVRRRELIERALTALILFEKNKHYVVVEGKIQIVDEHTGRIMPDRSWEQGLHQLIEIKENCEITSPRSTLVKISYQRFFRLYHHLGGMTGTAKEVAREFWNVYHLPVTYVPPHKENQRIRFAPQFYANSHDKWQAVIARSETIARSGRAVLIGTASVGLSEFLSEHFRERGVDHSVLNAKHDKAEADIISTAGHAGKITIATNMAGRGTDIKLSEEVRSMGGLHVILTEFHDASRIDRQLEGRCARQGDPGSFEMIVSLEDGLITDSKLGVWPTLLQYMLGKTVQLGNAKGHLGIYLLKKLQKNREQHHMNIRSKLLDIDEKEREMLAFSGKIV